MLKRTPIFRQKRLDDFDLAAAPSVAPAILATLASLAWADTLVFGPYWVGTLSAWQRSSNQAADEGLSGCKHTHGELGIYATVAQHVLLTGPRIDAGNQTPPW